MLAGKWFHRKNNHRNRIPSHRRGVLVVDGDEADAAGVAGGAVLAILCKPCPPTSPRARRPKKQPQSNQRLQPPFPPGRNLPRSAGRLTKCGRSSNHSNRLWSKWRKCRNWLKWRIARNPPTNAKLNHCAGRCDESSRRAATRTRRPDLAATRIPQTPVSGGGSRREHCGNRTKVCAAFQSAPAIARRCRP